MTLPDFIILGAQKAGTTWLAHHLRRNPEIFMPRREVHYFDSEENFVQGKAWYEEHFAGADAHQIVGEKTPDYLWVERSKEFHHDAPTRICELLPNAKFVITLRDPVTRAVSAINHQINLGRLGSDNQLERILREDDFSGDSPYGLIERGDYARNLQSFFKVMDRSRFKILFYEEDIRDNPLQTLQSVEEFLGLRNLTPEIVNNRPINAGRRVIGFESIEKAIPFLRPFTSRLGKALSKEKSYWRSEGLESFLTEVYAEKNQALFELLGRSTDKWRSVC